MTDSMKCPICGKDLIEIGFGKRWFLACDNSKCRCKGVASYVVWEYIDRTHKALDVAVDALKDNLSQANFTQMLDASRFHCIRTKCELALEQIRALEQKDE